MTPQKLKFANPYAADLGDTFGIPQERREEIERELNAMVNSYGPNYILVYASEILQKIEAMCNTHEEFTWALCNHLAWIHRNGRALMPKKNNKTYTNAGQ